MSLCLFLKERLKVRKIESGIYAFQFGTLYISVFHFLSFAPWAFRGWVGSLIPLGINPLTLKRTFVRRCSCGSRATRAGYPSFSLCS